jgi:DNA-binding transcriptional MerR regulator
MYKRETCKLTGSMNSTSNHYAALENIIEQAQSIGFELDELIPHMQNKSASDSEPLVTVKELIKKMRHKLYQQMMEFEILDSDLAELQCELLETGEETEAQAVTLTLV